MLEGLLSIVSLDEVFIRVAATAVVIVAVTWSVELFGPLIGGVLAGLPITLGPGFYFLVGEAPAPFVAQAACYALLSLCATQGFLLAYLRAARQWRPALSILCAIASWLVLATILHGLPALLWLDAAIFVLATIACIRAGRSWLPAAAALRGKTGVPLLLLRGVLAGVLVAAVTSASHWLGPVVSGLLLSFPIGYTVISVTLHQQQGAATAIRTLYSALFGTIGLAGFCVALALAVPHFQPYAGLALAFAASLTVTSGLVLWRRMGRAGMPGPQA